ncbi:MAG: cytochrome C oxidase subunit IV family protein [Anaerolineae bacterium]|nr:cytochrome C oxidase subunit IV family protein [Anaerolineae bacterium]
METKERGWRRGWIVFGVLALLTAAEFGVSLGLENPLPVLAVIALAKAGAIIAYFMRLGDLKALWRGESDA